MKNINRKKIIINIVCVVILVALLNINSYAANETKTNNAVSSNNSSTNTTSDKTSNANLKNLGIKPNDFKGFSPETTTYKVNVPEKVEEIEVYAIAQNSKAIVDGTGKKSLIIGENNIKVIVTAEDKTQKTYTIQVNRGGEADNENEEDVNGLSELKIDDLELSPEFKTDIYEYSAKYIGEGTTLNIKTVPTMANYEVEVIGNKDLKEGENNITILVSEANGDNVDTYQITVNKSLIDEEAIAREENDKKELIKKAIIAGGIVLFVIIILIIIIKHKRNKQWENDFEEDEEDDYYEDENNVEEEEDLELPRALKENISEKSKQEIKEEYLSRYSKNEDMEFYDNFEKTKKKKSKGKRYK